jgi:enamine deaminase RidA (YjgF/YER057c/UK114 family)
MATKVRFSNPATVARPPGYTHVVEISGPGRIVYFAGQLGLDLDNKLVGGPGDFRAQATQAFENMRLALKSVGGSFTDVVKINNYLTDMSHIGIFREVRDQFVNTAAPPASTTIAIPQLARPGALFEIEAVAMLGAKAPAKIGKVRGAKKTSVPKRKKR